jgi:hypothetical protein
MTDNPYVEARLAMDGLVHRGEIHTAPITNRMTHTPDIGLDELQLLECEYQGHMVVDNTLSHVSDQSLTAEVVQWQGLQKHFKVAQELI